MPRPILKPFRLIHKGLLALALSASTIVLLVLAEGMVLRWLGFRVFQTEQRFSILQYCPPRGDGPALTVYWLCDHGARTPMRHCLELIYPEGREPQSYEWDGVAPRSVVWTSDRGRLAFCSIDGTIYTWDSSKPGTMPEVLGSHKACASTLSVTTDDRWLVVANDLRLSLWDLEHRRIVWFRDDVGTMSLALHPTSGSITCGTARGEVLELDLETGRHLRTVAEHGGGVDCLAISADGKKIASIGVDRQLVVSDWASGETLWTQPHHANAEVCLSADGETLVTSGFMDNAWAIVTWHAATGEQQQRLLGHRNVVLGLHVTEDNTLYSWGTDGTIRTWDMQEAAITNTWVPHPPPYEEVRDVQANCS